MKIKFVVSLLPYIMLAITKIRENGKNKTYKNEGIIFLLPILGLLFENQLIMMTIFIVCSVLASLYRNHIYKKEDGTKLEIALHSLYYLMPILIAVVLFKEEYLVYLYIVLGILIYTDNYYNSLIKKVFTKGNKKSKKKKNEKKTTKEKKNEK